MPIPYSGRSGGDVMAAIRESYTCDGCGQDYKGERPAYQSDDHNNSQVFVYCSHYCYYDEERDEIPDWVRDERPQAPIHEYARLKPVEREQPTILRDKTMLVDDRNDAVLTNDGLYRYRLTRTWDVEKPTLAFIMLNPSTADATTDDPTIRRCLGYAEDWGYGRLVVGNLFAYRTSDPSELRDHESPVGPENDRHLREIASEADRVVAAWGTDGDLYDREREVCNLLDVDLYALNTTKHGHPNHPLYQPKDAEPEVYDPYE